MLIFLLGCSDYEVNRRVLRDSYVQPGRSSGVDILWVVDNSASMFEEQDQLISHATSFIGFLSLAPIDFQMGITTMDMNVERSLYGDVTSDLDLVFISSVIAD